MLHYRKAAFARQANQGLKPCVPPGKYPTLSLRNVGKFWTNPYEGWGLLGMGWVRHTQPSLILSSASCEGAAYVPVV